MSDPIPQNRDPTPRTPAPTPPPHFTLRSLFIATAIVAMIVAGAKAAQLAGVGIALFAISIATWTWASFTGRREIAVTCSRVCFYGGIALLVVLLFRGSQPRSGGRRATCLNNLKNLGQALLYYERLHGNFPPVHTIDQNGAALTSWRTSIMPHIDRTDIHAHYHADEPWNSPANNPLAQTQLELLKCPSSIAVAGNNLTSYVAIISPGGAWIPGRGLKLSEIKDDPRDTILLVEMRNSNIPWAEPRDLDLNNLPQGITPQNFLDSIANHPGIVNVLFADGSVQFIPTTIPWPDFLALLTIAGGEMIDRSKW